ncbi:phosphotransferase family protein [Nocardioides marmorisolisilvae]|uniref:Phosphotransferase family protein n=1 Tax=Nocardioides marmorisolisilvae TaxID=1542737 RepID=A0A3N0DTG7_9ACTN|nr:phosphotransferase family protein [Nocardioides marmorisolisilvae]RNL78902.1 phosphotransferase family protein [Nocardioides marmorisolisilvae]
MTGLDGLVDLDALTGWLHTEGLGSGPVLDATLLTGGTQNILVRFSIDDQVHVLRRPPRNPRPASWPTLLREARVLGVLTDQPVPSPAWHATCEDESVLGAPFFLMEAIDGFHAASGVPELYLERADLRHRMGLSAVEGIAALAALDYEDLGLADFGKPDGFPERQVGRWTRELESYADQDGYDPASFPDVSPISAWLEAGIPASFRPGIVHGDFHAANLLFSHTSGDVAAILDWEMATIGDPLLDLGWFVCTWPSDRAPAVSAAVGQLATAGGLATRAELIEHYAARSDRDVSNIDWYGVLACFKLGIVLEGSYARACAGKMDRGVGEFLRTMALALVEQAHLFMDEGVV